MTTNQSRDLTREEQHIYQVLRSKRFLSMEGLSKEVPFFIYPYPPAMANEIEQARSRIATKLRSEDGLNITEIDLYDLAVRLLVERGVWQRVLDAEPDMDKDDFLELMQGMLDPHDHLAPAIREILTDKQSDMVFLYGLGEVFPFIRTHTVLENLQSVVRDRPLLAWFPGTFAFTVEAGHQMRALNLTASDGYYRAKDILEQEA